MDFLQGETTIWLEISQALNRTFRWSLQLWFTDKRTPTWAFMQLLDLIIPNLSNIEQLYPNLFLSLASANTNICYCHKVVGSNWRYSEFIMFRNKRLSDSLILTINGSPDQWISNFSQSALDIGRSDLVHLLCKICISDCKLPLRGVLWYIIKHLNKSLSSSLAL